MKEIIIELFKAFGLSIANFDSKKYLERKIYLNHRAIFKKYSDYTMVPEVSYIDNLVIASQAKDLAGDVVECGVWRGGMVAGISEILGSKRKYRLFDSFEGLPPAKEIDGDVAMKWQENKTGKHYYDNCSAEEAFARDAMKLANIDNVEFVKGWFSDTVKQSTVSKIALLRLDGDWYESTMTCLEAFYPKVVDGGIILIDDYYFWEGCSKAVHDYLSKNSIADRVYQGKDGVAYIIKNKVINTFIATE